MDVLPLEINPSVGEERYRAQGLAQVDFNGSAYLRAIPSLSPFIEFGEGFYHYEIEQHGRWSSDNASMFINVEIGEWQIVIFSSGGKLRRFTSITSPDTNLQIIHVEGDAFWDAAIIDLKVSKQPLRLDFHSTHVFRPADSGNSADERRLSFWMIDEILFRPGGAVSIPESDMEPMPENLLASILDAPVVSAVRDQIFRTAGRIRPLPVTQEGNSEPAVAAITNGIVFGRPALLGFFRSDELFILEETVPYKDRFQDIKISNIRSLKKATISSARFGQVAPLCSEWSDNIWHWFLENVSQVVALEQNGYQGSYLIPFNSPVYRDSLTLFGIDATRIREFLYDYVIAEELFVTARFTGQNIDRYTNIVMTLNQQFRNKSVQRQNERFYISRRGSRRIVNEDVVMTVLSQYGFRLIYMEDHSISDQIGLAASSDCIIGPHGAGMTAAIFMKKGSTIIELFAPTYVNPCMTAVCQVLGHKYFMLTSRVYMEKEYAYGRDINVDIPELKLTLRTALG